MQYQQDEFLLSSGLRQLPDGFGHRVEKVDDDEEMRPKNNDSSHLDSKTARIVVLEAQLSDHNVVRQKLTETKAKLDALRKENRVKTYDLPQDYFRYDEEKDEVCTNVIYCTYKKLILMKKPSLPVAFFRMATTSWRTVVLINMEQQAQLNQN